MRWPFAKDEFEHFQEPEAVSLAPMIEVHPSPGLVAAISHLHEDRPCRILDLGPAVAQNVAFFSRFPCRLQIADLLGRLAEEPGNAERLEEDPEEFFSKVLPIELPTFDLILAWNVFEHLQGEAARYLAHTLVRLTHSGARLFASMQTGRDTAAAGLVFAIKADCSLEYRPAEHLPAPRPGAYNPAAFAQALEGFAIDHSVVLRHGFHEYVAVRLDA